MYNVRVDSSGLFALADVSAAELSKIKLQVSADSSSYCLLKQNTPTNCVFVCVDQSPAP